MRSDPYSEGMREEEMEEPTHSACTMAGIQPHVINIFCLHSQKREQSKRLSIGRIADELKSHKTNMLLGIFDIKNLVDINIARGLFHVCMYTISLLCQNKRPVPPKNRVCSASTYRQDHQAVNCDQHPRKYLLALAGLVGNINLQTPSRRQRMGRTRLTWRVRLRQIYVSQFKFVYIFKLKKRFQKARQVVGLLA